MGNPAAGSGSTMPLSEIVQQVGIRDDIQVGYDQPVDGAFAVTLNDTDNGHLVFEDGRTGTKWFMPGDKVYITGVPDSDSYSLVSLSANAVTQDENGNKVLENIGLDRFYDLMGSFVMPETDVTVRSLFWVPEVTDETLDILNVKPKQDVFGDASSAKDYIYEHIDTKYAKPDGSFIWSDFIQSKHTFADRSCIGDELTFDAMFDTDESGGNTDGDLAMLYQNEMMLPLWDVDPSSKYYVAWLSNYHLADNWSVHDPVFTRNNIQGDVVDGCHFDQETGLAYIPKSLYEARVSYLETGEYDGNESDLDTVQCQMLIVNDENTEADLGSLSVPVLFTTKGDERIASLLNTGVVHSKVLDSYVAVPLVSNPNNAGLINWKDIEVFMNGAPVEAGNWSYNSETGVLLLSGNAVRLQSVSVFVYPQSLAEMVCMSLTGEMRSTDEVAMEAESDAEHVSFLGENSPVIAEKVPEMADVKGSNPGVDLQAAVETLPVTRVSIKPWKEDAFIGDLGVWKFSEEPDTSTKFMFDFGSSDMTYTNNGSWAISQIPGRVGSVQKESVIACAYAEEAITTSGCTGLYSQPHGPGYSHEYGSNSSTLTDAIKAIVSTGNPSIPTLKDFSGQGGFVASYWVAQGATISNGQIEMTTGNFGGQATIHAVCSHSEVLGTSNTQYTRRVVIRVVAVGDGWALIGFANAKSHTQEASVYIKVAIESVPQDVYVEIQKEIEGKCAEGNPLFDNLSGIKFSVINKDTGELVATLTTNEKGYAKSDKLKYSKTGFDIQEISIPDNLPLKLNSETKTIVIDPKKNNGVGSVVIADKIRFDPLRLTIIKRLSNGLAGSLDDLANAGISVVGIPFKFEYIPDLNFTWSQAQGNYSSKVHYSFQAKTVKRGNRATIELSSTSGCLDSSTISDLKDKGYWLDDGPFDYAAFPPGFIVVSEMPHAGVQLLKTKMLYEIPMNGAGHWVTNNSDDDISYGVIGAPEVTVNNKYKTFIIEFPKVDKDTGESEGQGDAVLDAEN